MRVIRRRLLGAFLMFAALFMAGILMFVAGGSAAMTTIFVNGTWSTLLYPGVPPPDNSGKILQGQFQSSDTMVVISYDRDAGILTSLNGVSYDVSVKGGAVSAADAVMNARANDPLGHINVAGESQGADAVLRALKILEDAGFPTSNIDFWAMGNVDNNDGGLLTRLQFLKGLYIPLIGVTYGTQPTEPQYSHVIEVSNQYDGATDVPKYILNIPAVLNCFLGAFLYGTHIYNQVDIHDPNNVVTTNSDGTVTNIFVPHTGTLPILRPLLQLGVPHSVVDALDPFMRAIIETGYDRPDPEVPGSYPDHPVGAQLLPGPDQWVHDTVSIVQGLAETLHRLGTLAQHAVQDRLNPTPPVPVQSAPTMTSVSVPSTEDSRQTPEPVRDSNEPDQAPTNRPVEKQVVDSEPLKPLGNGSSKVTSESSDSDVQAETPNDKSEEPKKESEESASDQSNDASKPVQKRHRSGDGIKRVLDTVHKLAHPGKPKKDTASTGSSTSGADSSSDSSGGDTGSDSK